MLRRVLKYALNRKLRPASELEHQRVADFRARVAALPALVEMEFESESDREWYANRRTLQQMILTEDPRRFLEWKIIRKTMYISRPKFISKELRALRNSGQWKTKWKCGLREDDVGLPERHPSFLASSGNLIHHAYSLYRLEQATGTTIEHYPRVFEFGGGYGSMCRLIHRLGFRGEYVIFDFPEFCELQRFFLKSAGITVNDNGTSANVRFISDLAELVTVLKGNMNWLFVALWSISETSVQIRERVLSNCQNANTFLISYQDQFGEVDNREFFSKWCATQNDVDCQISEIPHLEGNRYLFGLRTR